jgi:hypothetical protein
LFKTTAAVGIGIAIFLFVDTVFAYRYVNTRFASDQGMLQAVREVSSLEHELRRERVDTIDGLRLVLRQMQEDRSDEIAWIRVLAANSEVEASSGTVEPHALPPADRIRAVVEGRWRHSATQDTSRGRLLIALLPFHAQAPQGALGVGSLVEVGIYLRETESSLRPLGRNLLISTLAAILLLALMIVLLFRLPAYVRGRAIENQIQLARSVQRKLLPETVIGGIEFAGECLAADEVGGDYYDVFRTHSGETVLVLADVSGKGLPAAVRMGVVYGAIRALSMGTEMSVARMVELLNELLRERTSREFVTLFWAFYNPKRHDLRYVNAGHLPPLLMASMSGGMRRLETGGTVVGLIPKASYQEERINLEGDEILIAYSDGLLEATDRAGEEFGESRVVPILRTSIGQSARDVLGRVMEDANRFIEGGEFHDDLTVLVAKLVGESTKLEREESFEAEGKRPDGASPPVIAA